MNIKQRLGWKRDLPDIRDKCFIANHLSANSLPPKMDLESGCPPIVDQGNLGSCVANAIAGIFEFCQLKQKLKNFTASRLYIYYNVRVLENTVNQDSGAQVRDGFKSIAKDGVCKESSWKYDINKFTRKPTKACYKVGDSHIAVQYLSVNQDLNALKGCLADGFPVVIGFSVYSSFESDEVAKTGIVPMPQKSEQLLGGHCVALIGYDDSTGMFKVRNSWGTGWGDNGYFYMPYEYLTNSSLASDFWTCRIVK